MQKCNVYQTCMGGGGGGGLFLVFARLFGGFFSFRFWGEK